MAKKTYKVDVSSAVKRQALEALLIALGFEKAGPDAYVEVKAVTPKKMPAKKVSPKPAKPIPKRAMSSSPKRKASGK